MFAGPRNGDSQRFFTGLSLVSISLAAHGSLFFTLDRAVSHIQIQAVEEQQRILKEKGGRLEFQFIEAPPKTRELKPIHAKKISSHDTLNQDSLKDKSKAAVLPYAAVQGRSDQLAQHQGKLSQAPSPRVNPTRSVPSEKQVTKQIEAKKPVEAPFADSTFLANKKEDYSAEKKEESKTQESQPSVKPKAKIRGNGGTDKITTQEMSRIKSPGAMLFGQTSFEATGSGMGEYMKNLKEKIWLSWFPYLAYQYPQDFRGADVVVGFLLDSKGEVKIIKILDSVGSPLFASYCVEAIQKASGFGPLPQEILELVGKDGLEIKFGFHYR